MLGFDPPEVIYHAGLGLLFLFLGFRQVDPYILRQAIGGLGVWVLVIKSVMIVALLVAFGYIEHFPLALTCFVVGISSILAARYLPDGRSSGEEEEASREEPGVASTQREDRSAEDTHS